MAQFLQDGFKTLITFAMNGAVKLKEREVTPPGLTGGGAINTSTMRNNTMVTKSPKSLMDTKGIALQCNYDPAVYNDIKSMLLENQQITVTFPDNSKIIVWGWIEEFQPTGLKEGDFPIADVKIELSNVNGSGAETAPVYSAT